MRRTIVAAVASLILSPAIAGDLTWHFFKDDQGSSGVLAVLDADEIDSPEPHYPFLLSCSLDQEWTMYVSDVDAKALGETIAGGEQPTFALVLSAGGNATNSGDYFPEISFGQMEGVWQYSTVWDLSLLDQLVAADGVAVKGTGIELTLPSQAMADSLKEFQSFCGSLSETIQEDPNKASP